MKFIYELNESQVERLKKWQEKIKKKHGKYGHYTFSFTPYGMCTGVEVRSHLTNKTKDLTEW